MTPYKLLLTIALVLAILGLIKPGWPLVAISVILLAVALLAH